MFGTQPRSGGQSSTSLPKRNRIHAAALQTSNAHNHSDLQIVGHAVRSTIQLYTFQRALLAIACCINAETFSRMNILRPNNASEQVHWIL